jgi:REP element-mobilizing transposase RayT
MTFLLTFSCYGARLHGDEKGSVNRNHNCFRGRYIQPTPRLVAAEAALMREPPYRLDGLRRAIVLESILAVCARRGWMLLAAHVRETHVHAVLDAGDTPEPALNALKAYASRALNDAGLDDRDRRRWSRHGSTRWLWTRNAVEEAIRYVVAGQGQPMEVFVTTERW